MKRDAAADTPGPVVAADADEVAPRPRLLVKDDWMFVTAWSICCWIYLGSSGWKGLVLPPVLGFLDAFIVKTIGFDCLKPLI